MQETKPIPPPHIKAWCIPTFFSTCLRKVTGYDKIKNRTVAVAQWQST